MAKNEKLNEEAAQNNNTPLSATTDDILAINAMNDRNTQLPKPKDRNVDKKRGYLE